jgi:hypothetical protein
MEGVHDIIKHHNKALFIYVAKNTKENEILLALCRHKATTIGCFKNF